MWTFQYKNGDRPLEGYTIQSAAGRGGFGEVYYALSDSGREVALKAVTGYEQIEVRGISQCMNLKSPHLVTIFDVKYNAEGKPFVIMEFVGGPNLRQMLDECPAGLGTQKAAFFLREIGKGLTFLHECGIVHRDLKPGNIFFENGYVKIGDYGLSKAISPTQHSGQTVTVGTVHYMAPEVGAGKYDRSIDIYAMGTVLYEMLTGTVPFIGASPSEILIKHLSAEADCAGIPEPFCTVIKKAMAKNPGDRYQSIQEMVEAVFGAEHVRMSVSHFSPDDLSMVAGRVAAKMAVVGGAGAPATGGGSSSVVGATAGSPGAQTFSDRMNRFQQRMQDGAGQWRKAGERLRQLSGGLLDDAPIDPDAAPDHANQALYDPLPRKSRYVLGALAAVVVAVASALLTASNSNDSQVIFFAPLFVFFSITGASLGLLLAWRKILRNRLREESQTVRRLAVAGVVSGMTLLLGMPFWLALPNRMIEQRSTTWVGILIPLIFMNSWNWVRANRRERVSLGPAFGAGIIGLIVSSMFGGDGFLAMAVLAGTALVTQVLAPWDPKRGGSTTGSLSPAGAGAGGRMRAYGNVSVDRKEADAMRAAGVDVYGNLNVRDTVPPPTGLLTDLRPLSGAYGTGLPRYHPVPRFAPMIWLAAFVVLLTIGLMCVIAVKAGAAYQRDIPMYLGSGFSCLLGAAFCFINIFRRRFSGWWSYLIRPGIMLLCVISILVSLVILKNDHHMGPDDRMVAAFFIVFPGIVFLTLPFLPSRFGRTPLPPTESNEPSPHNRGMALGMAVLLICGVGGIQRFYVGKIGTGILWLLTFGLFGVGQLIDLILICTGQFRDAQGRVLKNWDQDEVRAELRPVPHPPFPPLAPEHGKTESPAPASADAPMVAADASGPAPATPIVELPQAPTNQPPAMAWSGSIISPEAVQRGIRTATGGIFAAIAALLTLATLTVALAIGLDLPQAVASGLPDPHHAADIRRHIFGEFTGWATLVRQVLWAVAILLTMLTVGATILARRYTSLVHLLRGLAGIAGLLLAVVLLCVDFQSALVWDQVSQAMQANAKAEAIDAVLAQFRNPGPIVCAGLALVSFLGISVPYRSRAKKGSS